MKLALDPQMFYSTHSVLELPDVVARTGYSWMELSPKDDFVPFFRHPRADDATVHKLRRRAAAAGVGIASVLPVLRWSGPDEDERQAAVRAWKRAIQITVDLDVDVMNSEFNGRPEAPEYAESQFLRSLEELAPLFEAEGVRLVLEPHPDDFIEDGHAAVNLVRGLNADWIDFLYCTPHTFHQGGGGGAATGIITAAGEKLAHVHLADTLDHTASNGLRYIVNPPGSTARVHQHAELGRGEVDFDEVFAALAAVGFDGVLSSCVFGWEEHAEEISVRQREKVLALVDKHLGADHRPATHGAG
ncbi:sugar phosphate isomerase/epimerase family protein [Pseudonocardia nematodicida]|uniref:Sugar phosphate isomerase/epimerase family protein n=1 Tax=Pseudonocardia nematodicida TaxID=1206997 RepID=A0ABV1KE86_9PSEU